MNALVLATLLVHSLATVAILVGSAVTSCFAGRR
jgi:hypothetical protein